MSIRKRTTQKDSYVSNKKVLMNGKWKDNVNEAASKARYKFLVSDDLKEKETILQKYPEYFSDLPIEEQIYFLNRNVTFFKYCDNELQIFLLQKYPEYYLPFFVAGAGKEYVDAWQRNQSPEFWTHRDAGMRYAITPNEFDKLTSKPMSYEYAVKDYAVSKLGQVIDIDPGYFDGSLKTKEMDDGTRFETLMEYAKDAGLYEDMQKKFPDMFEPELLAM